MGLSKSKTKTENTPVYSKEIEGAASTLKGAYTANQPNVQANADAINSLVPTLLDRFNTGDPGVNAAKTYNQDVLGGKYLDEGNPYLEDMIGRTNDSVRNQTQAAMGLRGQTGGSDYAGVISDRLAGNELGLRYQDYGSERDRMGQAVSQSGQLAAADQIPLAALMSAGEMGSMLPIQAAGAYAAGTGGLLGQYQTQKQTSSPGFGNMLGGIIGSGLSGWAAGVGGK